MSTMSSDDHLSPHNPLYYAPRRVREKSQRSSASFTEAKSERLRRLASNTSVQDALLEDAVAKALSRPLEPEVVRGPDEFMGERNRRKSLLRVTGGVVAAVGIAAIAALAFVVMIPMPEDHAAQADGSGSSMFGILASAKAALHTPPQRDEVAKPAPSEVETILASSRTEQPVTHEQSETLLQQFLQWQRKP